MSAVFNDHFKRQLFESGRASLGLVALVAMALIFASASLKAQCVTSSIGLNTTVSGNLSSSDCPLGDGTFYDWYQLTLPSAGVLQIDMVSSSVDAYLFLLDINLQDNNSGGATNARIRRNLSAGTYQILANSLLPQSGPYSLTTSFVSSNPFTGNFDGIWTGDADRNSSTSGGNLCQSAKVNALVKGTQIKGTGLTDQNQDEFSISGSVNSSGMISNGAFASGSGVFADFEGTFTQSTASGTWSDMSTCTGTFKVTRRASYVSGFDELWTGRAESTAGPAECDGGDIIVAFANNNVTGSVEALPGFVSQSVADVIFVSGALAGNRHATGNLTVGSFPYGNFEATIGTTTGSGTWSNFLECSGTLSFTRIAAGDSDSDGVDLSIDNCPDLPNTNQLDTDNDNIGNACDSDDDNDWVSDPVDNCPLAANANQLDLDEDGLGDACDPDIDGDGLSNVQEADLGTDPLNPDTDGDGVSDKDEVDANTNPLVNEPAAAIQIINSILLDD